MLNKITELLEQAQELTTRATLNDQPLTDTQRKAIRRIKWLSSTTELMAEEPDKLSRYNRSLLIKEQLRNGEVDGNEGIYNELIKCTVDKLKLISPDSLKRYVGLLETPKN